MIATFQTCGLTPVFPLGLRSDADFLHAEVQTAPLMSSVLRFTTELRPQSRCRASVIQRGGGVSPQNWKDTFKLTRRPVRKLGTA